MRIVFPQYCTVWNTSTSDIYSGHDFPFSGQFSRVLPTVSRGCDENLRQKANEITLWTEHADPFLIPLYWLYPERAQPGRAITARVATTLAFNNPSSRGPAHIDQDETYFVHIDPPQPESNPTYHTHCQISAPSPRSTQVSPTHSFVNYCHGSSPTQGACRTRRRDSFPAQCL